MARDYAIGALIGFSGLSSATTTPTSQHQCQLKIIRDYALYAKE
jgi:hypothetical protein